MTLLLTVPPYTTNTTPPTLEAVDQLVNYRYKINPSASDRSQDVELCQIKINSNFMSLYFEEQDSMFVVLEINLVLRCKF